METHVETDDMLNSNETQEDDKIKTTEKVGNKQEMNESFHA